MRALVVVLLVVCVSCGDNTNECGEGTDDNDGDGFCEALPVDNPCGDGTVVDPISGLCVVDPNVCTDGTVLIRGECRDPASDLRVDLVEGPEPNGFEPNATPAGTIGSITSSGFVIRGCVAPVDNNTPDFDVYFFTAGGPTLLHIAADGVQGLAAGFTVTFTGVNPLMAGWQRLGIDVATDTSVREVFLPAAGVYRFAFTDSRTLLPITTGGEGAPAAGNPDGTSCYFVTIDRKTPMPVPLDGAGDTATIGEDLRFYTSSTFDATTQLTATIQSAHAQPALVVLQNDALLAFDDDGAMTFDGTGNPLIAGDFVFNYALFPAPYRLVVQ